MATSILESLMSNIDPQMLGSIASKLGESKDSVRGGLQGGAATMLSALAGKAGDSGFLGQLMGLLNNPALSGGAMSNIGSLLGGGSTSPLGELGSKFVSMLFGSKLGSIADVVGRAAGLGSSSAGSLMGLLGPLLLGTLSQRVRSGGLNASSLGSLLSAEAPGLSQFLPAGIGSLLGGLSVPHAAASAHHAHEAAKEGGTNWLWPALGLALLLGGLLWFFNTGGTAPRVPTPDVAKTVEKAADTATTAISDAAKSAWAALGEFFKRKLPNGIELNIPRMGVENRLIDYIEDASKVVDKTTWFDFDRLLFDTGKATLQPDSQDQLQSVANIMKAYPNVEVKIGGYTDNTGDKAANMKLSADRAKNVMDALVGLGIAPSRLTSEGYGDQHPVADNATEEGRAKNRRISMRVTKK